MYELIQDETGVYRRAIVEAGAIRGVQEKVCSRHYHVTDPDIIAEQLRATNAYKTVEVIRGGSPECRGELMRNRWASIVIARDPWQQEGYGTGVSVFCDHAGKRPVLIQPHAVRLACDNQFRGAPLSFRHTASVLPEILANLHKTIQNLLHVGITLGKRVEELQEVRGRAPDEFRNTLALARPKLAASVAKLERKEYYDGSLWGVFQAFTGTRSPLLARLTTLALDRDWEMTAMGGIPPSWAAELN